MDSLLIVYECFGKIVAAINTFALHLLPSNESMIGDFSCPLVYRMPAT